MEKTHFFSFLKIIIYLFLAVLGLPAARAFLVAQLVKNPPAMQETWVRFLGREDALEQEMATHSSILAWRIPWTEKPGRLQSVGLQEPDTTEQLSTWHTLTPEQLAVPPLPARTRQLGLP